MFKFGLIFYLLTKIQSEIKVCTDACNCFFNQIDEDLKIWTDGIHRDDFEKAAGIRNTVHYQIIDGHIYRSEKCLFGQRCKGIEKFLIEIADSISNVEFIINVYDHPIFYRDPSQSVPLLTFSKPDNRNHYHIIYPAWTFWQGGPAIQTHPSGLGRWDRLRDEMLTAGDKIPWNEKIDKGFFRGSRTSKTRDPLVLLSRKKPNLVDAAYTKNQAWKSVEDTLGHEPADIVSLPDHCQFKYLFNFRGVAASFRLKHLFLCNSLVFHVVSNGGDWLEFFYKRLIPWQHYIPVSPDLSDVEQLLEWAQLNDTEAQRIAIQGKQFIENFLTLESIQCYWKELLTRISRLTTYEVTRNTTLVEIKLHRHNEL